MIKERNCKTIDFAVSGDSRIEEKEKDRKISRLGKGVIYRRYGMLK